MTHLISTLKISVVIPWCNRNELALTLSRNRIWIDREDVEIVAINCGGDKHALREILSHSAIGNIRQVNITRERFNKALALNIGVHCSRAAHIFILDCDIVLSSNVIDSAIDAIQTRCFVTIQAVTDVHPECGCDVDANDGNLKRIMASGILSSIVTRSTVDFTFRDGSTVRLGEFTCNLADGSRSGEGLLLARKEHLVAINGYHSQLESWGWEDDDVQFRLKKLLGLRHVEIGEALHIRHGDDKRALYHESLQQSDWLNFCSCCDRYSRGDFQGTYANDVANWREVVPDLCNRTSNS
jgi:hypothetical protein